MPADACKPTETNHDPQPPECARRAPGAFLSARPCLPGFFFLAFSPGVCYTFPRTEQKTAGAFRPCLRAAAGTLKGKRVQIPHDLVTVIRESTVRVLWAPATEPSGLGRRQQALNFQSGNLPAVGTGASAPDHEELVVPKSPNHCKGSFCFAVPQAKRPFFRCSGPLSCALLFSAAMFQTGKEAHT